MRGEITWDSLQSSQWVRPQLHNHLVSSRLSFSLCQGEELSFIIVQLSTSLLFSDLLVSISVIRCYESLVTWFTASVVPKVNKFLGWHSVTPDSDVWESEQWRIIPSKEPGRTLKAGHGTKKRKLRDRRIVSQLPLKLYDQFISCRSGWCWKPCEVSCSPTPASLLSVKLDVATDRISQGKKSASQTEGEIR